MAKHAGIMRAKKTRNPLTPRMKAEVKEYKLVIGITGEVYGIALTGDELEQRLDTLLSANGYLATIYQITDVGGK